jgi:hypothetical protein
VTRFATAELESLAVPDGANVAKVDTSPALQPTPHVRRGTSWVEGAPLPVENRIVASFTNASFAELDVAGAGINLAQPASITVTTDGPMTLRVLGTDVALAPGARVIQIVGGLVF